MAAERRLRHERDQTPSYTAELLILLLSTTSPFRDLDDGGHDGPWWGPSVFAQKRQHPLSGHVRTHDMG